MQVYYTVDAPYITNNIPYYSTTDPNQKYFSFVTNEIGMSSYVGGSSDFKYLGTAVYYKIYNNYSTMQTRNASISSVNTSSNYSAAAERVINTYGYLPLGMLGNTNNPLIEAIGTNQTVYIRLMNYQSAPTTAATITVNGTKLGDPRRDGDTLTFDFGRTADDVNSAVPVSTDDDYVEGSFSYEHTYYVDLYAMGVGRDATYTMYYSNVLHLGAVAISSSTKDN